jgi:Flp pilus assembly protein CpaB
MTYRVRNIVLAVALAALAALLVTFYVANYKKTVQQGEKNVTVYVATKKIEAGMSGGEALRSQSLRSEKVARRSVVPGAISNPAQIEDLVATEAVYAGEQVTVSRFRPVQQRGVRAQLTGNQRAYQLAGDPNQLLVGTLKTGDRVDLVAKFAVKGLIVDEPEKEKQVVRTVLRDLLVLNAPESEGTASKLGAAQGSGAAVQLALTDAQARKVFYTTQVGSWTLTLRPVVEPSDSAERVELIETVVCDGLPRSKYGFCNGGLK